jgi:photosystem II stability/assembly factor-like uncharacterized protein
MKKLSVFVLAFVISCWMVWPSHAAQVVKQFEERSYYLKDICLINSNVGWSVGAPHWDQARKKYVGTIIKTSDGGTTWQRQTVPASQTLRGVSFVDANYGWAVGEKGTIVHTADGGKSWKKQTVATTNEFRRVVFVDRNNGWATGIKPIHFDHGGDADAWKGSVWHTNNGGLTWKRQTLPPGAGLLNRIEFINAKNGWVVGVKLTGYEHGIWPIHVGAVYQTTDGGRTWVEQYAPDVDIVFTGIDFVDENHGWVVGFKGNSGIDAAMVYHTADGGKNWEPQGDDAGVNAPWDVHFVDSKRGYMAGFAGPGSGWVRRTLDGGETWKEVKLKIDSGGEFLYGIAVTADRAMAVGNHDVLCLSNDPWGEYEWPWGENLFEAKYINVHYRFEAVFFTDEDHGWAVGKRSYLPRFWGQVIFNTQNGGKTWKVQYKHAPDLKGLFEYSYRLDSVFFSDPLNGWAVGGATEIFNEDYSKSQTLGALLHTSDGGKTWVQQGRKSDIYREGYPEFFAVQFLDDQNGWALEEGKYDPVAKANRVFLARTTNGGVNWEWINTGQEGPLGIGFALVQGDLDFPDDKNGWVVGGLGTIIHTEDGGKSWMKQGITTCGLSDCPLRLFAVDFIDSQKGWIVGEGLYRTSNGGANWTEQPTGIAVDFHDIQFVDSFHGWIAGSRGAVMNTIDGGDSWKGVAGKTSFDLLGLSFLTPEKGWIVGDGGVILAVSP